MERFTLCGQDIANRLAHKTKTAALKRTQRGKLFGFLDIVFYSEIMKCMESYCDRYISIINLLKISVGEWEIV